MSAMAEYLRRAAAPRIVVATSRRRWLQQWRVSLRRSVGLPPLIELFLAFDDPYAAIALPGLLKIAAAHDAHLKLRPLITRGIDGDPAGEQRRVHAITDSRRLAQRDGRALRRSAPLPARDCAFLATWTATAEEHPKVNEFVAAALNKLWFESDGSPAAQEYQAIYQSHIGAAAPAPNAAQEAALAANAKRLKKLGHWESPTAYIAGEWFFAHERLAQIDSRLRALGA
jgi:2-hydroxychromene-2-carboxylate isomerase